MATTPSAVVTAQVDAFNVRDLDAFCATYASEAAVSGVTPQPIVGRDALRAFYADRFRDPELHCVIDASVTFGDRWLVAHELVTTSHGTSETIATFEVRDGLITRASMVKG